MDGQRRYARNPDFVHRQIADEVILVPIRHNFGDLESIFTLNEVAARIWDLLDGGRTLREVRDVLLDEFDVSAEEAGRDLEEFVTELEDVGAVRLVAA